MEYSDRHAIFSQNPNRIPKLKVGMVVEIKGRCRNDIYIVSRSNLLEGLKTLPDAKCLAIAFSYDKIKQDPQTGCLTGDDVEQYLIQTVWPSLKAYLKDRGIESLPD